MGGRVAGIAMFIAMVIAVCLAVMPSGASAAGDTGPLGTVYHQGVGAQASVADARPSANLRYHGGAILPRTTPHAVFWDAASSGTDLPSFPTDYDTVINQYFHDVAADSGLKTNVYGVGRQYFDVKKDGTVKDHARYDVVEAAPTIDADPYPPSACPVPGGYTHCITDAQIRQELLALGVTPSMNDIYFVLLPKGVATCVAGACSATVFCAYHLAFYTGAGWILYANQPYASISGCRSGERPNNNDADDTINVISHEHNEIITDPIGRGWWASHGGENGDKCVWSFGAPLGTNYNQVINGDHYFLQREWSNYSRNCRQRPG